MTQHFMEMLRRAEEIHLKKNQDYTTNRDVNPYENFDRSNHLAAWFPDSYKSFAVLIGTKLARLSALLSTQRTPKNESLDDTFLDLVVYCILFYCYWKEHVENKKDEKEKITCTHYFLTTNGICKNCKIKVATLDIADFYKFIQGEWIRQDK